MFTVSTLIFLTFGYAFSGIEVYNGKALSRHRTRPDLETELQTAVSVIQCILRCISYSACALLSFNSPDSCFMLIYKKQEHTQNTTLSTIYCIRNCTTSLLSTVPILFSSTLSKSSQTTSPTTSPPTTKKSIHTTSPTIISTSATKRTSSQTTSATSKTTLSTLKRTSQNKTYRSRSPAIILTSSTASSATTSSSTSFSTRASLPTSTTTFLPNDQGCRCLHSNSERKHIYITSHSSKARHHPVYYYDFIRKKFLHLNLTLEGNIIRISADSKSCRLYYIRRLSKSLSKLTTVCFDGSESRVIDHGQLFGLHLDVEENILFYGKKIKHKIKITTIKTNGKSKTTVAEIKMHSELRFDWKFLAGDAKAKLVIWSVTTTHIQPHMYLASRNYGRRGKKQKKEISLADTGGCLASASTYLVQGDYLKSYDKVSLQKVARLVKCPFDSFPLDPIGCAVDTLLFLICQKNRKTPPYIYFFTMQKKRKHRSVFPFKRIPIVNVG